MSNLADRATAVLFALACGLLAVLVSLRLWDRWTGQDGRGAGTTDLIVEVVDDLSLDVSSAARRGSPAATVSIIEFSDFECPFCGKFFQVNYPQIQQDIVDKGVASYSFVHFPLDRIHPRATRAAEAAECAGRQALFWAMHDLLFSAPRDLSEERLFSHSASLGLDSDRFQSCMAGEVAGAITAQRALAESAGVTSTPTFLIGTIESSGIVTIRRRILGAHPLRVFIKAIREVTSVR